MLISKIIDIIDFYSIFYILILKFYSFLKLINILVVINIAKYNINYWKINILSN